MDEDRTLNDRDVAAAAGDLGAFRELVERQQRLVFGFVRNLIWNSADAEDIVQAVFVAAFRKLSAFDPERSQFSTWLLTIARNRCLNHRSRGLSPLTCQVVVEIRSREVIRMPTTCQSRRQDERPPNQQKPV